MEKPENKANTQAAAAAPPLSPAPALPYVPYRTGKKAKREAHAQTSPLAKKLKYSNTAPPKKKQEETFSCEEKGEGEGERGCESCEEEEKSAGEQVASGKKGCVVAEKGSAADSNNGAADSNEKPAAKSVAQTVAKQDSRSKDETFEEIDEKYAKEGHNSSEKEASEGSEEGNNDEKKGLEEVTAPNKTSIQKDKVFKYFSQKMPNASAAPGLKTLFLGNLAYSTDLDDVYQFFEDAVDVRLAAKADGSLRGFGHVDFATEEAAMKAMEKHGQELCGRCVRLEFARERGTPEKQDGNNSNRKGQKPTAFLRDFDEYQEEDDGIRMHQGYAKEGNKSREKEVSEGSEEGSDDEMEGLEEVPAPNKTSIQKDKSFSQKMPIFSGGPGLKTLYLGNLAYSADIYSIYQFFEDVVDVRLATNANGSLRGFGHVDFPTEEAAMKAMEKNGQEFFGRRIILEFARERGTPSRKQDGNNSYGMGQKPTAFVRSFEKYQVEDDGTNMLQGNAREGNKSREKEASEGSEEGSDDEMEGLEEVPAPDNTSIQKDNSLLQKMPILLGAPGLKTLYLGNLAYSADIYAIYQFFEDVVDVRLATNDDGFLRGFGHVDFPTEEAAVKAMGKNGQELCGRRIILEFARERGTPFGKRDGNNSNGMGQRPTTFVRGFDKYQLEDDEIRMHQGYAKEGNKSSGKEAPEGSEEGSDDEMEGLEEVPAPDKTSIQKDKSFSQKMPNAWADPGLKTLYLGNIAYSADIYGIYQLFEDVVDVRLALSVDGSHRGFGHVDFPTEEAAMKAMKKNGQEFCGRRIIIEFARDSGTPSRKQDGNKSNGTGQKPTAFVRGFDKYQVEDDVRNSLSEHFKICGEIVNIRIPTDSESGCTKGFAYVEFKDIASLSKALELNDIEFSVGVAKERSGGRNGGRRGGGKRTTFGDYR